MAYATLAQLQTAFGAAEVLAVADRDHNGVLDTGVVEAALARADAVIDSYLASRYSTPISDTVPVAILNIALDLARYWLYDDAAPERVQDAYTEAVAWLKDVATGKVVLALPSASASAALATGSPLGSAEERLFTRTTLSGF